MIHDADFSYFMIMEKECENGSIGMSNTNHNNNRIFMILIIDFSFQIYEAAICSSSHSHISNNMAHIS